MAPDLRYGYLVDYDVESLLIELADLLNSRGLVKKNLHPYPENGDLEALQDSFLRGGRGVVVFVAKPSLRQSFLLETCCHCSSTPSRPEQWCCVFHGQVPGVREAREAGSVQRGGLGSWYAVHREAGRYKYATHTHFDALTMFLSTNLLSARGPRASPPAWGIHPGGLRKPALPGDDSPPGTLCLPALDRPARGR